MLWVCAGLLALMAAWRLAVMARVIAERRRERQASADAAAFSERFER